MGSESGALPACLLLVRHGHTAGNATGSDVPMSGWDDLPLGERGREQARLLRDHLGPTLAAAPPLYCSSSRRAVETAEVLWPDAVPRLRDDLREIHCGEVDGWRVSDVKARYPLLWAANERQDDPAFRWPGGESYLEFRARCARALDQLAAAHPGERMIVVTHAGVIAQIVGIVRGVSAARWSELRPSNCSVTEVLWGAGTRAVLRFSDPAAPVARVPAVG